MWSMVHCASFVKFSYVLCFMGCVREATLLYVFNSRLILRDVSVNHAPRATLLVYSKLSFPVLGISCRCSPPGFDKSSYWNPHLESIRPSSTSYSCMVLFLSRTTNQTSILNPATPSVGVALGVQAPRSGFESPLKTRALLATTDITPDFLTVNFGRTPRYTPLCVIGEHQYIIEC
jgi:hypothetical protein